MPAQNSRTESARLKYNLHTATIWVRAGAIIYIKSQIRLSIFPGDPRVSNPHVLFNQLPKELPPDIPLPEGSRVLGTLIRGPEYATSVLDVDLPAEQVLDFYREHMQAAGWQESELLKGLRPGGFTHQGLGLDTRATFCRSSRGPGLTVIAHPRENISTDLRLEIDLSGKSCAQQARISRMTGRGMVMEEMIPRLDPPPGGKQMLNQGGGGLNGYHMNATLELDAPMDLAKLAAHYATPLKRRGTPERIVERTLAAPYYLLHQSTCGRPLFQCARSGSQRRYLPWKITTKVTTHP